MNASSSTFDFARLGLCVKRDIMLNGRSWMLRLLMMVGVTAIVYTFATWPGLHYGSYQPLQLEGGFSAFKLCGVILCAWGASLFMENMTSKSKRITSLMNPASQAEKFVSRWLICLVGVTLAYLVCFGIADIIRIGFIRLFWGEVDGLRWLGPFEVMTQAEKWSYPLVSLISTQATFMLGSTVWPDKAFQKTFGFIIVLAIACGVLTTIGLKWFITSHVVISESTAINLNIVDIIVNTASVINAIWVTFCYVISWMRFREAEVINRF